MNCPTTLVLVTNKLRLLILFCLCFVASVCLIAQDFPPKPDALVYDETNFLSEQQTRRLNAKLMGYMDSTSTQIAVVILRSTQGYPIDDYSFQLGEHWGIGQDEKDNGVLILVVPEDREMWIATGYGVEPKVTDAFAKRLVVKILRPAFREGESYKGLDQATNLIMSVLSGEFEAEQLEEGMSVWSLLLLFLAVMIAMYVISKMSKGGSRYYDPERHTYMGPYRGSSTWKDFSGGSGSFGGGSGGGFGGFGGGSFGGGGAGGSW